MLKKINNQAQKIKVKKPKSQINIEKVMYQQDLLYVSETIKTDLINKNHNDFFIRNFEINKI